MTITKKEIKQRLWMLSYFILFFFIFCSVPKKKINTLNNDCKLLSDNLNRVSFSENHTDLCNLELDRFYDDNNKFDIIFYYHVEGSNDYRLKRFYKDNLNKWRYVIIEKDKKNNVELLFDESEIIYHLNNIEEKAFYQYCGNCFDCTYHTLLIKKDKTIFKYYSNGDVFIGIDELERNKILNYIDIYNFFNIK